MHSRKTFWWLKRVNWRWVSWERELLKCKSVLKEMSISLIHPSICTSSNCLLSACNTKTVNIFTLLPNVISICSFAHFRGIQTKILKLASKKLKCIFAINWYHFLCWVDELMKLVNSYMECMRYLFIPAKCLICERGMQNSARVHPLSHGNFCINSKYSWFKHNLSSVPTFQLNFALALER